VTPDSPDQRPTSRPLRLVLFVVLVVLLLAGIAAVAGLAATRTIPALGVDGSQAALQRQREDAMNVARQFMLRVNTYGPDDLDADGTMPTYRKDVEAVITPKFKADFEKNVPTNEQIVKQSGAARVAEVYSTGVSAIDDDSATALVAGQFTNSYPKSAGSKERVDTEPSPFRVQVSLVKIKGQWLVDDFTPLTGQSDDASGGGTGGSTELPSIAPSSPSGGSSQ
jgi:Mce-associated membrane protein